MTESTNEEVAVEQQEASTASKRKTLSLSDRIKVIDYLRSQVEPIVADSNSAVAALISAATGVEIDWPKLKYMFDELEDMNLASKVYVKSLLSTSTDDERIAALEARVAKLESTVVVLASRIDDSLRNESPLEVPVE